MRVTALINDSVVTDGRTITPRHTDIHINAIIIGAIKFITESGETKIDIFKTTNIRAFR